MAQSSVLNADLLATPLAGDLEASSDPRSLARQTSFIQGRKISLVVATLNVMNAIMLCKRLYYFTSGVVVVISSV